MATTRTLALHLSAFLVIACGSASSLAQPPPTTAPNASIEVRILMEKEQVPPSRSPTIILTIWNTSHHLVRWGTYGYRVHIEGKSGEPPKTVYHRQLLGDPSVPPLNITLNVDPVSYDIWPVDLPYNWIDRKFILSKFYDLDATEPYSAYLEIEDDSGIWLRTNTVQFEVQPETAKNTAVSHRHP